jgi:uncharacterized cupredoxin-like copper-binding protein
MKPCRLYNLAAVAVLVGTFAFGIVSRSNAHDDHKTFSAGEPGDPRKPARTVEIIMKEEYGAMAYVPNRIEVKHNEQIRFVLKNVDNQTHEFLLASAADNLKHAALMKKFPEMEHDDPNGKTLKPNGTSEILWRFSKRGTFEFACLIPGHREAGMIGTVIVK